MNRKLLKRAKIENVLRLAKYVGLRHSLSEMSLKQLASLVWWKIKPRRY
jgi:hypothetical protein